MELNFNQAGDEVLAALIGELDTPATVDIQPDVDRLLGYASKTIHIDCTKLKYIASSGLRQLITIYKRCKAEGGHMILSGVNAEVMEILKLTNFDKIFDIR